MGHNLRQYLDKMKETGWPAYKIEKEVKIANGVLGKIRDGKRIMTQDVLFKIIPFYKEKVGQEFVFMETKDVMPVEDKWLWEATYSFGLVYIEEDGRVRDATKEDIEAALKAKQASKTDSNQKDVQSSGQEKEGVERAKNEARIAELEKELKSPPKSPLIGMKAWLVVREKELKQLREQ